MKLIFSFLLTLSYLTWSFAQASFQAGFFITNDDQKVECLIKNKGWKNSPEKIEYKLSPDGEPQTTFIASIKEFSIGEYLRFERWAVDIDQSPNNQLSHQRDPEYLHDTVFLKLLIDGEIRLYQYETKDFSRFFFQVPNSTPQQLVYKRYWLVTGDFSENFTFRGQLQETLKCRDENGELISFDRVDYSKKELISAFEDYYECTGKELTIYQSSNDKFKVHLGPRASFSLATTTIQGSVFTPVDIDFERGFTYRIGADLEIALPTQNHRWAIIFEPAFHSYQDNDATGSHNGRIQYQSLELGFGARHYLLLDQQQSGLFLNGLFILDQPINNSFFSVGDDDYEVRTFFNLAFGAGYLHRGKLSLELRFDTKRNIFSNSFTFNADYHKQLSFVAGYRLF